MNAIVARAPTMSLAPQNFGEAVEFAKMMSRSAMVPKDYVGKPENIMVAIQWGAEVGLGPLQALNGISVINGRPSLWGDAAMALVRAHPACAGIREGVDGEGDDRVGWCEITRKGEPPQRRTFSVADAKKAGLFGKTGPWQQYPQRMLQLRARGFAIRDVFPDALRGVITTEEAQDLPVDAMPPARGPEINAEAAQEPVQTDDPADPDGWPMLAPDNTLHQLKTADGWVRNSLRVIGKLEDRDALDGWITAMRVHFDTLHPFNADAVQHVRKAAGDRRVAMIEAQEQGA